MDGLVDQVSPERFPLQTDGTFNLHNSFSQQETATFSRTFDPENPMSTEYSPVNDIADGNTNDYTEYIEYSDEFSALPDSATHFDAIPVDNAADFTEYTIYTEDGEEHESSSRLPILSNAIIAPSQPPIHPVLSPLSTQLMTAQEDPQPQPTPLSTTVGSEVQLQPLEARLPIPVKDDKIGTIAPSPAPTTSSCTSEAPLSSPVFATISTPMHVVSAEAISVITGADTVAIAANDGTTAIMEMNGENDDVKVMAATSMVCVNADAPAGTITGAFDDKNDDNTPIVTFVDTPIDITKSDGDDVTTADTPDHAPDHVMVVADRDDDNEEAVSDRDAGNAVGALYNADVGDSELAVDTLSSDAAALRIVANAISTIVDGSNATVAAGDARDASAGRSDTGAGEAGVTEATAEAAVEDAIPGNGHIGAATVEAVITPIDLGAESIDGAASIAVRAADRSEGVAMVVGQDPTAVPLGIETTNSVNTVSVEDANAVSAVTQQDDVAASVEVDVQVEVRNSDSDTATGMSGGGDDDSGTEKAEGTHGDAAVVVDEFGGESGVGNYAHEADNISTGTSAGTGTGTSTGSGVGMGMFGFAITVIDEGGAASDVFSSNHDHANGNYNRTFNREEILSEAKVTHTEKDIPTARGRVMDLPVKEEANVTADDSGTGGASDARGDADNEEFTVHGSVGAGVELQVGPEAMPEEQVKEEKVETEEYASDFMEQPLLLPGDDKNNKLADKNDNIDDKKDESDVNNDVNLPPSTVASSFISGSNTQTDVPPNADAYTPSSDVNTDADQRGKARAYEVANEDAYGYDYEDKVEVERDGSGVKVVDEYDVDADFTDANDDDANGNGVNGVAAVPEQDVGHAGVENSDEYGDDHFEDTPAGSDGTGSVSALTPVFQPAPVPASPASDIAATRDNSNGSGSADPEVDAVDVHAYNALTRTPARPTHTTNTNMSTSTGTSISAPSSSAPSPSHSRSSHTRTHTHSSTDIDAKPDLTHTDTQTPTQTHTQSQTQLYTRPVPPSSPAPEVARPLPRVRSLRGQASSGSSIGDCGDNSGGHTDSGRAGSVCPGSGGMPSSPPSPAPPLSASTLIHSHASHAPPAPTSGPGFSLYRPNTRRPSHSNTSANNSTNTAISTPTPSTSSKPSRRLRPASARRPLHRPYSALSYWSHPNSDNSNSNGAEAQMRLQAQADPYSQTFTQGCGQAYGREAYSATIPTLPSRRHPFDKAPKKSALSPRSRAALYEKLCRPVSRDTDAISASTSDQQHCTFAPTLAHASRAKFPSNGGFQDRLAQYSKQYAQTRCVTPPLERECTFAPQIYISQREKKHQRPLSAQEKEEIYKRLAGYRVRTQQQQIDFPFQPALNIAQSRAIQAASGDTRTFEERYRDDLLQRQTHQRTRAEQSIAEIAFKPQINNPSKGGGLKSFLARTQHDLQHRVVMMSVRDEVLGVAAPDEPHKRRLPLPEDRIQMVLEAFHNK